MNTRTLLLIFLLIAGVVGLLVLSINRTPQPSPTPAPTPVSFAKTTLFLTLGEVEGPTATDSGKKVDVNINTSENLVTAVQLELSYNPKDLMDVDIEASVFFQNPVVLLKNVDEKNGRVSYALGIAPGQSGVRGKGTVAVLTFNKNETSASTSTTISFLPKTLVSAQGITPSVLKSETGITFSLK